MCRLIGGDQGNRSEKMQPGCDGFGVPLPYEVSEK